LAGLKNGIVAEIAVRLVDGEHADLAGNVEVRIEEVNAAVDEVRAIESLGEIVECGHGGLDRGRREEGDREKKRTDVPAIHGDHPLLPPAPS
jgi:hypothetical protein